MTPAEPDELIRLTNEIEHHDVERLAALAALADLRHVSLADLMESLGISPSAYA